MLRNAIGALVLSLPLAAMAAPENYTLDSYHTYSHFSLDHLGVATMWGRFDKNSGKFMIDRAAKKGAIDLTIEAASVSTGDNDKGSRPRSRDEHLRSADFFNVAEFPRITFKGSEVKFSGDSPVEVEGQLTLLGVTKPLTLKIERWVCKDHPFSKRPMCGGNATGKIKRSEFGMKFGIPSVGDDISLFIGFEAYKD